MSICARAWRTDRRNPCFGLLRIAWMVLALPAASFMALPECLEEICIGMLGGAIEPDLRNGVQSIPILNMGAASRRLDSVWWTSDRRGVDWSRAARKIVLYLTAGRWPANNLFCTSANHRGIATQKCDITFKDSNVARSTPSLIGGICVLCCARDCEPYCTVQHGAVKQVLIAGAWCSRG